MTYSSESEICHDCPGAQLKRLCWTDVAIRAAAYPFGIMKRTLRPICNSTPSFNFLRGTAMRTRSPFGTVAQNLMYAVAHCVAFRRNRLGSN